MRTIHGKQSVVSGIFQPLCSASLVSTLSRNSPISRSNSGSTGPDRTPLKSHSMSPSRFLIPLSYASILGSTLTLIGTSVNLVVAGLIVDSGMEPMGFFELLPAGLPIAVVGLIYLIFWVPRHLPDRLDPAEALGEKRREYVTTMVAMEECDLLGQTVEEAGLRHLPGLFLVEIDRRGQILTPIRPDQVIEAGDHLVFAGVVSTIIDLQRNRRQLPIFQSASPVIRRTKHFRIFPPSLSKVRIVFHRLRTFYR